MVDFDKYFKALKEYQLSEITEHSHRSNLQQLIESLAGNKIKILHEPKREGKFGAPDFKVINTESIIGYIENKKIEENLDKILKSEQIKKYQALSDNILLTNYIEWIWIKGENIQQRETLCFLTDIENKKSKLNKTKVEAVEKLIKSFLSQAPKEIAEPKILAHTLAVRAKLLKDFLLDDLQRQEQEGTEGRLYQLYETFKTYVFHELTTSEFSDAFAQTLVYGLFLAKLNAGSEEVSLFTAKKYIPLSFELIKELVNFLDEMENPEYSNTKWIVEEVLTIMNNLDLRAIQETLSFSKKRKDTDDLTIKDPYVYFYEDFLAAYDKKLREAKGVYYTPPQVVNFIVRAIDDILVDTFKIKEGLGDRNKVTVLDFATGTGTFLVEVFRQILEKLPTGHGKNMLLAKEHILKNIFGFEYLIAPYTIAHLKLSQFLKDIGLELKDKERLQVFLTNTLEMQPTVQLTTVLTSMKRESIEAQKIKGKHILVITGNPPYSGISKNKGKWISDLINDYKYVDGKYFEERKHWLNDDYVKFIRFAQDKMENEYVVVKKDGRDEIQKIKTDKEGIVAVITNHSFLDNPTFRGMRQSLMKTFNQLYFLDLHGNAKKKEKAPDGSKDENVFDIEQGVTISILIKNKKLPKKVYHADYWGSRTSKYERSLTDTLEDVDWKELSPNSPFYFFIPKNETHRESYDEFWSVAKIFGKQVTGIVTARDDLAINFTKQELIEKLNIFKNLNISDSEISEKFKLKDSRGWKIPFARKEMEKLQDSEKYIKTIDYRPFDRRYIFYHKTAVDWGRWDMMPNMLHEGSIGLVSMRQYAYDVKDYCYSFVTIQPIDNRTFVSNKGTCSLFPLYLFETIADKTEKRVNFTETFKNFILEKYKKKYIPEHILGYIYAILYNPAYRSKYAEFLKSDFPRIPFAEDEKLFKQLAEIGYQLICTHIGLDWLKPEGNLTSRAVYPEPDIVSKDKRRFGDYMGEHGEDIVKKIEFLEYPKDRENPFEHIYKKSELGIVKINEHKFYDLVPEECWEFQIGGYTVLQKYLKDRKGRTMSLDELEMFEKAVRIIHYTIQKMKEINKLTQKWI